MQIRTVLCLILILCGFSNGNAGSKDYPPLRSYFTGNQPSIYDSSKPTGKRIYLAPGPLKPGKIVGEYAAGSFLSVAMGMLSAVAGSRITHDFNDDDGWNFSGLTGAFIGYWVGSVAGSTVGVCTAGNTAGEHGSVWATLGGSILGTAGGTFAGAAIAQNSAQMSDIFPIIVAYTVTQTTGAVLGFNLTRKKVTYESRSP